MTPRGAKKFLFDRSFDDPAKLYLPGERKKSEIAAAAAAEAAAAIAKQEMPPLPDMPEEVAEPVAKPEFTQAQIDAAREEGYIAGHTAALEEAGTSREHYVADAMNLIVEGLARLDDQQKAANTELADVAMRMIYGITQRLLPRYAHAHAVDTIEQFVRETLPVAVGEPRILVRAHEMIAADLEERLKDVFMRASFQGTYSVIVDYELQPGDCRLEWDGGGAERNEARIWRDIREIVASNFGGMDADEMDRAADQVQDEHAHTEQAPAEPGQDEQ
jgi:flagellar assembly protein FliH